MKFASIGHLMTQEQIEIIPKSWQKEEYILSPEFTFNKTSGYLFGIKKTAKDIITKPREEIRNQILEAALHLQNNYDVELVQLGALTTSVTEGGKWLSDQLKYRGFVNHGDTYTAAVACNVVHKMIEKFTIKPNESTGRKLSDKVTLSTDLKTNTADVVITATNHPSALIKSAHLKKGAIIVDVAQPSNVSYDLCNERTDIVRLDGGYVSIPQEFKVDIPGYPPGKIFSCISEVIMQALENDRSNHVGSIDMKYLEQTENWAKKYGFLLKELTNFGKVI
jgi:predicted amino acid dehydrogenase